MAHNGYFNPNNLIRTIFPCMDEVIDNYSPGFLDFYKTLLLHKTTHSIYFPATMHINSKEVTRFCNN